MRHVSGGRRSSAGSSSAAGPSAAATGGGSDDMSPDAGTGLQDAPSASAPASPTSPRAPLRDTRAPTWQQIFLRLEPGREDAITIPPPDATFEEAS